MQKIKLYTFFTYSDIIAINQLLIGDDDFKKINRILRKYHELVKF